MASEYTMSVHLISLEPLTKELKRVRVATDVLTKHPSLSEQYEAICETLIKKKTQWTCLLKVL